jgi:hypothetical protein
MSFNNTGVVGLQNQFSGSQASKHLMGYGIGQTYFLWDFNLQPVPDPSIGSHKVGLFIPKGAIIKHTYLDVIVSPTSAGNTATVGISHNGQNLVTPAVVSGAPWSTLGLHQGVQDDVFANYLKTTADAEVLINIAVQKLTAGKFYCYIEFDYPSP